MTVSGVELCPGELQDPVRGFSFPAITFCGLNARLPPPLQCRAQRKGGAQGRPGGLRVAAGPGGGGGGRGQRRGGERRGPRARVRAPGVGGRDCVARMLWRSCQSRTAGYQRPPVSRQLPRLRERTGERGAWDSVPGLLLSASSALTA